MRTLIVTLLCTGLLAFGLLGCGGEDEDAPQLSASHPGWERADCAACHTLGSIHGGDRAWDECFGCHGGNGQPARPAGHHDTDCTSCHNAGGSAPWNDATHADYAASPATSCRGCHDAS